MDKSWMTRPKWTHEYREGIENFLEFASQSRNSSGKILCPCKSCINRYFHAIQDVKAHLLSRGMFSGYVVWNRHGEDHITSEEIRVTEVGSTSSAIPAGVDVAEQSRTVDIAELLQDAFPASSTPSNLEDESGTQNVSQSGDVKQKSKFLEDAEEELYSGCKKFSKLAFILHLYRLKCLHSWTTRSFDMLLELLNEAFPEGTSLPKSTYELKKVMKAFDLGYTKIDACINDCTLFWKEKSEQDNCHVCEASRWVSTTNTQNTVVEKKKKKAQKVVRYFPLAPRLKRLFKTKISAENMIWHAKHKNQDGFLRHPADGAAWKAFDSQYPDFASDPRNVRLALSSDGFNPFSIMSSTYSIWPVVLVAYNTPPWVGMKQSSFILSTIVPGAKSPGNNIDIFLQPLVDELRALWQGVQCYDAATGQNFNMRAMLMWTINDFPAYGMLSGWSTKGRLACPCCAQQTESMWLYKSKKFSYMGHRRWLPVDHFYRERQFWIDNTDEVRIEPKRLTGVQILSQVANIHCLFGKTTVSRSKGKKRAYESSTIPESTEVSNWKKKSIFFDLPYWADNILPHNLDVMHIEKNVCENFIATLLDLDKSKDSLQARQDLVELGIQKELHPQLQENGSYLLPPTCFTMSRTNKLQFCEILAKMKLPKGYSSNISRCVNIKECKIIGLKTHDCHVIIEDLLPIALSSCAPSDVLMNIIIEISAFLKIICSKVIDPNELDKAQLKISITLCQLEKNYLPSFFTIMIHLLIHLAEEVRLGGPVQYRWMYPFER